MIERRRWLKPLYGVGAVTGVAALFGMLFNGGQDTMVVMATFSIACLVLAGMIQAHSK